MLHRLVYSSRATTDLSASEITDILTHARRRNARDGITGLLLYHDRSILQVLEGGLAQVDACYARIQGDNRHTQLRLLSRAPCEKKFFSDWFMGYEAPGQIAGAPQKALITLEQLDARLREVDALDVSEGKRALMSKLRIYLLSSRRREAVAG